MSYWEGIIACGLADYPAVSLAGLFDSPPPMERVHMAIVNAFQHVFHFRQVKIEVMDYVDIDD
jgi:lipoate-protein ligase B